MEGGWTTPFVPKELSSEPFEKKRTSWPPSCITTILPSGSMAIPPAALIAGFVGLIRAHAQVAEREVGLAVGRVARQDEVAELGLSDGEDSPLVVECDGVCRLSPRPDRTQPPRYQKSDQASPERRPPARSPSAGASPDRPHTSRLPNRPR